jgi:hypothetical protein
VPLDRQAARAAISAAAGRFTTLLRETAALDTHQLRFAEEGGTFNQSRGGITEHDPTRWRN